jgi:hypothetical protein
MSSKALKPPVATLYDEDFVRWTEEHARLLRDRRFDEIDVEHLAEEIEDMGRRDAREMRSRLTVLIGHLLKWKWQPDRRSGSWRDTIREQRREIGFLIDDSPSLKARLVRTVESAYHHGVDLAVDDTGLPATTFPSRCPFSLDQVLDAGYLPD